MDDSYNAEELSVIEKIALIAVVAIFLFAVILVLKQGGILF